MPEIPPPAGAGPAAEARLQPFRADPILRWLNARPAWMTPAVFALAFAALALCAWLDGTLRSIEAPPGRYPDGALLVPFLEEWFGPVFVLGFFPALALYARLLDRRIVRTAGALYQRSILHADVHSPEQYARDLQARFDSRWAWLLSALFCGWFVALWIAARLGWLDDSLGIVVHVASQESRFGFAWILAFSLLGPHLFMSVTWRVMVCAWALHQAFRPERKVHLQPLHPDNCCGLRFIGSFTLLLSGFVAFFPLFLALLAWFYPRFLDNQVTGWALMYSGAAVYVAIATFVFVFPTYQAHRLMVAEREAALDTLNRRFFRAYEAVFRTLESPHPVDNAELEASVKLLETIRTFYREVRNRAIWPFNVRVVSEFVGVLGIPLLLLFLERLR